MSLFGYGFGFSSSSNLNGVATVPVTTGLVSQHDASNFDSLTMSAGRVSAWADVSGNSFDVFQTTGSAQPFYDSATFSRPVLDFQGAQHIRRDASFGDGPPPATAAPFSWYVVYSRRSTSPTGVMVSLSQSGSFFRFWNVQMFGSFSVRLHAKESGVASGDHTVTTFDAPVVDDLNLAVIREVSTSVRSVQGNAGTVSDTKLIVPIAIGAYTFGALLNGATTLPLTGAIAEVLFYNRILTAPEDALVKSYLETKWSLKHLV
jgi:hypothetical protein